MGKQRYTAVTTRRFRLRTKHEDWLEQTECLYNDLLSFYYDLFLDQVLYGTLGQDQKLNGQQILRELEKLSIVGRDGKEVSHPLPWEKVPLYFRRAAINAAIAAGRSWLGREAQSSRTRQFHKAVTFYKGMYKELSEQNVSLKVWDGRCWRWLRCRLKGNTLPEEAEILSPSVVRKGKYTELHVPVREEVSDGRKAKERLTEDDKVCVVQFTNTAYFAVCVILQTNGSIGKTHFIKGGNPYREQCRQRLAQIETAAHSMGDGRQEGIRVNQKHWMKLKHINQHYADQVSREIIDFCADEHAGTIVWAAYAPDYQKIIMRTSGNYSPLHLSTQIKEKIRYKAWREGILVLEKEAVHTADTCHKCGAGLHTDGEEYLCENGHRGNRYRNTAVNLGRSYLTSMQKNQKK